MVECERAEKLVFASKTNAVNKYMALIRTVTSTDLPLVGKSKAAASAPRMIPPFTATS